MARVINLSNIPLSAPLLDIIGVDPEALYEFRTTFNIPDDNARKYHKILNLASEALGGLVKLERKREENSGFIIEELDLKRMGYRENNEYYLDDVSDYEALFETEFPNWTTRYVYLFTFKPTAEVDPREIAESEE